MIKFQAPDVVMPCLPPIVPFFSLVVAFSSWPLTCLTPAATTSMGPKYVCTPEISYIQVIYILFNSDPPDDELWAMFEQFSRENSRSGLSVNEQLMRFNEWYPKFNIWSVIQI